MDGSQGEFAFEPPLEPSAVRRFLADNPGFLTGDDGLLSELGLKVAGGNVLRALRESEAVAKRLQATTQPSYATIAELDGPKKP